MATVIQEGTPEAERPLSTIVASALGAFAEWKALGSPITPRDPHEDPYIIEAVARRQREDIETWAASDKSDNTVAREIYRTLIGWLDDYHYKKANEARIEAINARRIARNTLINAMRHEGRSLREAMGVTLDQMNALLGGDAQQKQTAGNFESRWNTYSRETNTAILERYRAIAKQQGVTLEETK
jgi:hypothetical protein